jgi:hypothetical protein
MSQHHSGRDGREKPGKHKSEPEACDRPMQEVKRAKYACDRSQHIILIRNRGEHPSVAVQIVPRNVKSGEASANIAKASPSVEYLRAREVMRLWDDFGRDCRELLRMSSPPRAAFQRWLCDQVGIESGIEVSHRLTVCSATSK